MDGKQFNVDHKLLSSIQACARGTQACGTAEVLL